MPRDGSGIYTQPFPDVVDGTTIESAVHNGTVNDIEADLNAPRPIVAGGTGANNATSALSNLGAEKSMQVVTNYDTHVFQVGSFFSNAGATGEPVAGHYFMGQVYGTSASQIILEARDQNDNEKLWVRRKSGGVWGAWVEQAGSAANLDARYVNVTGDTMTGQFTVAYPNPSMVFNKPASGQTSVLYGSTNGLTRWAIRVGNDAVESGGNAGSDLDILAFADDGSFRAVPLNINRATSAAVFDNNISCNGFLNPGRATATGAIYLGNAAKKLEYDGSNFRFQGASLVVQNPNLYVGEGSLTASINFTTSFGTRHFSHDGTDFNIAGGNLRLFGQINALHTQGGQFNIDGVHNGISAAHTAIFCILSSFSGLIVVSNTLTGTTELFLCGAGAVSRVGGSIASNHCTCGVAPPQSGYFLQNNSGGTATFNVFTVRLRTSH